MECDSWLVQVRAPVGHGCNGSMQRGHRVHPVTSGLPRETASCSQKSNLGLLLGHRACPGTIHMRAPQSASALPPTRSMRCLRNASYMIPLLSPGSTTQNHRYSNRLSELVALHCLLHPIRLRGLVRINLQNALRVPLVSVSAMDDCCETQR